MISEVAFSVTSLGWLLWPVIAILVVVAWLKIRARRVEQSRAEDDDEPWAKSLTDEDVQDIYGDREERWESENRPTGLQRQQPWPKEEDR